LDAGAGSHTELSHAMVAARQAHAEGMPVDLLEALARVQGHPEQELGAVISSFGAAIASRMPTQPPLIPFVAKLIQPTAFYESFAAVFNIGKTLLVPVLYAEDTDAVGVGSVNPIAAQIMADEAAAAAETNVGIRPFITIVRLDYESWSLLTKKHFGT
jgi:hypothetical protein